VITPKRRNKLNLKNYCSLKCKNIDEGTSVECYCAVCNKKILKNRSKVKISNHNFCSRSCNGYFSATNKNYGIKRSKLELYIESQLKIIFPNLTILSNDHKTINSELDVLIPSLKIAFELSGIFHYQPIFGINKLKKIQLNDEKKSQKCIEYGISLYVIDTSKLTYTTPKNSKIYLDYIINIINEKILLIS